MRTRWGWGWEGDSRGRGACVILSLPGGTVVKSLPAGVGAPETRDRSLQSGRHSSIHWEAEEGRNHQITHVRTHAHPHHPGDKGSVVAAHSAHCHRTPLGCGAEPHPGDESHRGRPCGEWGVAGKRGLPRYQKAPKPCTGITPAGAPTPAAEGCQNIFPGWSRQGRDRHRCAAPQATYWTGKGTSPAVRRRRVSKS